jgi:hypothetical protein
MAEESNMANWRARLGALTTVVGLLALSAWTGSRCCRAEDAPENDEGIFIRAAHYTELLKWINDVKRPGFELLKAAKQNGYLIAVFKTKDGEVAFCDHRLEEKAVVYSLEVTDLDGKDLGDESASHWQKSLVRTKTPASTIKFLDGQFYPLRRPVPKKVRVIFKESEGEIDEQLADVNGLPDPQKVIFNEVIEME